MARRRGGPAPAAVASLPVVGTVAVMALVYYSTLFVFLDHWLGLGTPAGAAHAAAVSLAVAACFFALVCAAAADPGSVPHSFAPDAEAAQQGQGLKSRYCDKCCMFKPPRSHHCRVCKRCVLKMDHHCVWINNCVGYGNYKAFIICVLNATIGSLYSFVIFLCDLLLKEHEFHILYVKLAYILVGILLFFLSLTIGSLLCWHIYLLCHNMTTIEYREAVRAKWLAKKSGQKYRHLFDLGMWKNIQMILVGILLFFLSLTIGSLLCWHIYLLCHNMTTIEYREAVRAKWLAKKSGQKYRHLFDLGMWKNIQMILVGILLFFLSLTIGSLLCWHIYLLCHNMTTIEYREAVRAKWLAKKSGQKYRHLFDLGMWKNIQMILVGILLFFLSLTIGSLLCWHIYLLCHNMTTIEYREAVRAKWLAKKSGQKYRHLFDLGMWKNIQMILVGILLFFLSLTIGSLLCWHIYLLCHNMTTIEYREAVRAKWLAKKSGQKYRHLFDLGMWKNIQMILVGILLFFLSLTIGSLLCWHIYLLCHNMTTIEYREAVRAKWLAKKSGQKYRHLFDLGMWKNIQMILGPNILCWLCPTATGHLKDGTEFQITNN